MKRQLLAIPAVGVLLLATSCGFFADAGPQKTEDRAIQGVTAVRLLTTGDLHITVGQAEALTVTAGANLLVGLTTQVIDGTLILDRKSRSVDTGEISYALTVPPMTSVELEGTGSIDGIGVLAGDAQVNASGSGSMSLTALDLTNVVVDLSGSGDVELSGTARSSHVTLSGSGYYNGSQLATTDTDIGISGSGDASVSVTGRLGASVSGSGSVTYTGNPASVDRDTSGSGDITAG